MKKGLVPVVAVGVAFGGFYALYERNTEDTKIERKNFEFNPIDNGQFDFTASEQPLNLIEYTIRPGDTLWALGAAACTTEYEIVNANSGISDPDIIRAGESIVIPDYCVGGSRLSESNTQENEEVAPETTVVQSTEGNGSTVESVNLSERDIKIGQYLATYETRIEAGLEGYDLDSDVIVAQSILESGFGTSILAVDANNFFGAKAKQDWQGPIATVSTNEVVDKEYLQYYEGAIVVGPYQGSDLLLLIEIPADFEAYQSFEDGIKRYAETTKERFPDAVGKKGSEYVDGLLNGIYGAYATDPDYKQKVLALVADINRIKNLDYEFSAYTATDMRPDQTIFVPDDQALEIIEIGKQQTKEDYDNFVESIIDYTAEADEYAAYNSLTAVTDNPLGLNQPGIQFSTAHITGLNGGYRDVDHFLKSTNNQGGSPYNSCCGASFYIDDNAVVYRLLEPNERSKTNPPFDAATISFEIDAFKHEDLTPDQLKAAILLSTYLAELYDLPTETDDRIVVGHAEVRNPFYDGDNTLQKKECQELVALGYNDSTLDRCAETGHFGIPQGVGARSDWPNPQASALRNSVNDLMKRIF